MEKENKQTREAGRAEYNATVRVRVFLFPCSLTVYYHLPVLFSSSYLSLLTLIFAFLPQQLVEFVRKRDPRYKKYNEFISEQNAAKQAEAKRRAARDRAEHLASLQQYTEQEWAKVDNEEEEVIETDDDEIEEEYVCIACNKSFK